MPLPPDIRNAIETLAEEAGTKVLRDAAREVSERYRDPDAVNVAIRSEAEALAYLATRFPATFAAARFACEQTKLSHPDFQPESLVDIGAGPGTAALAALDTWDIEGKVTLLEPNPFLRGVGEKLFSMLGHTDRFHWVEGDVLHTPLPKADLVISGYVFNELLRLTKDAQGIIGKIWDVAQGLMMIVEPGTPAGFEHVLRFRDFAREQGIAIAAPCPHALECPLRSGPAWCHFSVRIERSRLHRSVKADAVLGFEDEKFSFVALSRVAAANLPDHRLIGHPSRQKVLQIQVCSADGSAGTRAVAKSDPGYRQIRKMDWGEGFREKFDET